MHLLWRVAALFLLAVFPAIAQVAVDPIRNRVYVAEEFSNRVAVVDGATGSTLRYVTVGNRPQFLAVNPLNGRIYVNNGADASLTVIEAGTFTTQTLPIGSTGPIAINAQTGKVYVVRYSTAATDEVTVVDEASLTWYSMATQSYQPMAIAVNPVTNLLYVAHYAVGHIRVIDGSSTSDFPPSTEISVWGKSMAITVNPVTGRAYSLQEDSRGPIAMITTDNQASFLAPAGHAVAPRAIAVNPVTNKVYAAFAGEVIVIDGASFNILAFIPSGTSSAGPMALGINTATNKVYVPNANGTLTIIDGATQAATTVGIPAGATGIGVNPVTNRYYVSGDTFTAVNGNAGDARVTNNLATTITPLAGNASGSSASITLSAANGSVGPRLLAVYYQLDGTNGTWQRAQGNGPYTASLTGLTNGSHTLHAFAVDAQVGPVAVNEKQNAPLVGNIASYTFTASGGGESPAVLSFAQSSYGVAEGGSQASVQVTRSGSLANAVSVHWTTANGSAIAGSDFGTAGSGIQPTGVLSWAAGDGSSKTITVGGTGLVRIIDDGAVESAESFTIALSSPSSGATVGSQSTTTINVADNDVDTPPPPPEAGVLFSSPTYTVSEAGSMVTLSVRRTGNLSTLATVDWTTANATAIAGRDFGKPGIATQLTGRLSWAANDGSARAISIRVNDDAVAEGNLTFTVQLRNPAGTTLGSPATATVTITDTEAPPVPPVPPQSSFAFTQPKYLVLESGGEAVIGVTRTAISGGNLDSPATVRYATVARTAVATSDFAARSGALSWAAGEGGTKTFSVPIVNDALAEPTEVFAVQLSSPTGAASIATTESVVLIVDDDEVFPPQGAMPDDWTVPSGAASGWYVSGEPGAFEGTQMLRSEPVLDGESAQVGVSGNFTGGTISFRVKVSSEPGFDFLRFYVDGNKVGEWTGTAVASWQSFSAALAPGSHTLTWSYEKDGSASFGADAAWLDAVTLPAH